MKKNEIVVASEKGLIYKIKKFFSGIKKAIFNKKENTITSFEENKEKNVLDDKLNFLDELKSENIENVLDKEGFIKSLDGNEEALKLLSIERLLQLKSYYRDVIEQNDQKIKELKMKLGRM